MPVTSDFDRYFLNLPPFDRERDFDSFWKDSIAELKKIPMEPRFDHRKHQGAFNVHVVSFKGFNRATVQGELFIPRDVKKPRASIIIPDYNRNGQFAGYPLDREMAYFFLRLRGHDMIKAEPGAEQPRSPGYMVDNITEIESYYLRGIYLDAYRAIDTLRLNSGLDLSVVGMMGKGLGAAATVFAASFSTRVAAVVLDTPSFCYLPRSQNISTGDASTEINEFLEQHRNKKKLVKKNLSYFDALNFSDRIEVPALVTVGFRDTISPPECVFALFNHLLCDKTIEVYPDSGNNAGDEAQFRKSIAWLKERILGD